MNRKLLAPISLASAALLVLTACGDSEDDSTPEPEETVEETEEPEEPEETEDAEESETDDAATDESDTDESEDDAEESDTDASDDTDEADGNSAGDGPQWATEVTEEGEQVASIEAGDVTVDVYEVAIDQAASDSSWADPDTEEPLVAEGDDVMVLNYVVTNNGDPVTLNYGLVDVRFSYDDWPYMQQPSVSDSELLESHNVNDNGVNSDSMGEDAYLLGAGEQYSVGDIILHQPGENYTISVEVTPRDDQGERLDESFEGELTGTIE